MLKNKKKIIILVIVFVVLISSYFGIKYINNANKKVGVTPVSDHNWGFIEQALIGGMVYESNLQTVHLDGVKKIEKVYVNEGDKVSAGDRLILFNLETIRISKEIKKIEIEKLDYNLAKLKRELELIADSKIKQMPKEEPLPELPKQECRVNEKGIYSCLNEDYFTKEWQIDENNSKENPLVINVNEEGKIYASFINALKPKVNNDYYVSINIDGQSIWDFNVKDIGNFNNDSFWFIKEKEEINSEEEEEIKIPEGITKLEKTKLLRQKEKEISDLVLEQRKAKLELKELEEQLDDGVVYAKKDGYIRNLQDVNGTIDESRPLFEVVGGTGVSVKAQISEFKLNEIKVDQKVFLTSFETGNKYEGMIKSVDKFSTKEGYEHKANVSYYNFVVQVDTEDKLNNGSYMGIQLDNPIEMSDVILLENAYIRDEKGKKYVMKEQDGLLVKQYIKTGKMYFGESTEVLEGLSNDDYIAFPYGDGAIEGVKAVQEESTTGGMYYGG